jgi:hypothetical protein
LLALLLLTVAPSGVAGLSVDIFFVHDRDREDTCVTDRLAIKPSQMEYHKYDNVPGRSTEAEKKRLKNFMTVDGARLAE